MSEKLTQKCNSSIAHIRNTLLCQRLFYHFPYFCPQKNISKGIMNKKLIITALCVPLGYDSDDGAEYHW